MIHELRTYTLKPGSAPEVAKNAGEVGRAIRGDNFGKLEGYWITEIGALNQVMHLWSYKDLNERARLRAALGKNDRWVNEYIPLIRPHLVRQDIRLLNPVLGINNPGPGHSVYELRYYRTKPGAAKAWCDHIVAAMPVREKYSKCVALWQTEASQPNEVCHLWGYADLNARMAARGGAVKDPGWQEFLKKSGPLLEEMNNIVMIPAAHSPLK